MFYSVKSTVKKSQPALLTCSLVAPTDLRKSAQQAILEFPAAHFKKHQLYPLTSLLLRSTSIYWNLVFIYFPSKCEQPSHENTTPWIDVTK